MDALTIIFWIVVILICVAFYVSLFIAVSYIATTLFSKIGHLISTLAAPLSKATNRINDKVHTLIPATSPLQKLYMPCIIFLASAILLIITFAKDLITVGNISEVFGVIIYNTVIGSFVETAQALSSRNLAISPAEVIAIGFTSYLSVLSVSKVRAYVREKQPIKTRILRSLLMIVYYPIVTSGFAVLAYYLNDIFAIIGNWGLDSIRSLFETNGISFFAKLGQLLLVLLLAYPTLLLLAMTLYEYLAGFFYGIFLILAFCLVGIAVQSLNVPDVTLDIILIILFFVADYRREDLEQLFEKARKWFKKTINKDDRKKSTDQVPL